MTTLTAQLGGEPVTLHYDEGAPPTGELLGLDVESTWMETKAAAQWDPDFRVRLVQFGTKDEAWVMDMHHGVQEGLAYAHLADRRNTFASHTNMDVLATWTTQGIDITERNIDTRMLAIMADPDKERDRDLKTLATAHGMPELEIAEAELYAWMKERWIADGGRKNAAKAAIEEAGWNALVDMPELPEVYLRYAGLDAIVARRLVDILTPLTHNPAELIREDQWLHVLANQGQIAGKRIDVPGLDVMSDEASLVTGAAKSKAMDLTGGVNINGPKIIPWLAEHGVDWERWDGALTKTEAPSLAKENMNVLERMDMDDLAREVVAEMRSYKSYQDIFNKTQEIKRRLVFDADGVARIHPQLNPIGASTTARMSASAPNMQNFSKRDPRLRGLFLPDPGHTLMTIDFAQIELRVVAALAREDRMIEVILAGGDLHQLTVELLAERGITITRDTAKMVNFLIVYGGGGKALHEQAGIELEAAYEIVRTQKEAYPAITGFSQWMAMEKTEIRTISNRRLPVTRVKGKGKSNSGDIRAYANVNYAVQSAAREALVYGWKRLESVMPGLVWFPVHDELVLMVREGEEQRAKEAAEWAMTFDFRGVPIEADAIELRDEDGVSRWMTGKRAEAIAKAKAAA